MNQRNTEYEKIRKRYDNLVDKIQDVLDGQLLDDVIPALTAVLSSAVFESGVDKKIAVSYVVNSIDRQFEAREK